MKQCTLGHYEKNYGERHLLHGALAKWAEAKPDAPALINHSRSQTVSWAEFDAISTAVANELLRLGFRKGDFLATSLTFLTEHVFLEYACFKIGVIHAPLDLRLPPAEVIRSLGEIHPRGFAFLGKTAAADFRELGRAVKHQCASVEHLIQFSPANETLDSAI